MDLALPWRPPDLEIKEKLLFGSSLLINRDLKRLFEGPWVPGPLGCMSSDLEGGKGSAPTPPHWRWHLYRRVLGRIIGGCTKYLSFEMIVKPFKNLSRPF